jgi:DNA-binding transcriptional LysR family regulator
LEIGQLEAFLEVVRHHSFSRAAQELGVTQPSLSARIITLERELGEPLFHRLGRGVRLTDAARTFLPYIQRSLDTLRTAREALDATRSASSGKLYIGAARTVSAYVLPGILEEFHKRYPGIDLAIKTGRSSGVLQMLLSEEIQVGVTRALVHPDLETMHLYDEQVVLVTHPEHPFARTRTASIYAVASEPLILYDKESTYFVLIDRVCREAGIVPNVQMDLDSIEATKRMIERGLGISFLPRNSLHRELAMGTLTHVTIQEGYQVTLPTAVMVRRAGSHSAIVTAFMDLLQQIYPDAREWPESFRREEEMD